MYLWCPHVNISPGRPGSPGKHPALPLPGDQVGGVGEGEGRVTLDPESIVRSADGYKPSTRWQSKYTRVRVVVMKDRVDIFPLGKGCLAEHCICPGARGGVILFIKAARRVQLAKLK